MGIRTNFTSREEFQHSVQPIRCARAREVARAGFARRDEEMGPQPQLRTPPVSRVSESVVQFCILLLGRTPALSVQTFLKCFVRNLEI